MRRPDEASQHSGDLTHEPPTKTQHLGNSMNCPPGETKHVKTETRCPPGETSFGFEVLSLGLRTVHDVFEVRHFGTRSRVTSSRES